MNFNGLSEDQEKQAKGALAKLQAEALAYPGYAQMLARNKVLKNPDIVQFPNTVRRDVSTFFTNNKDFDIIKTPYDRYIKGKTDEAWAGIENRQVVADQVRSMQRIHTVTGLRTKEYGGAQ